MRTEITTTIDANLAALGQLAQDLTKEEVIILFRDENGEYDMEKVGPRHRMSTAELMLSWYGDRFQLCIKISWVDFWIDGNVVYAYKLLPLDKVKQVDVEGYGYEPTPSTRTTVAYWLRSNPGALFRLTG